MTPARVAEGFANFSLVSNGDPAMKRLTLVITFVLVTLGQAQAQENRGSAKYMLSEPCIDRAADGVTYDPTRPSTRIAAKYTKPVAIVT
jgi:hypothetical protein